MTATDAALTVGDRAPDAPLLADDGQTGQLSALWSLRPYALIFLGPLDSDLTVDHAIQLRDGFDNMRRAGGDMIAVCADTPPEAAEFREQWHLPYRLICDIAGRVYTQFGVTAEYPGTFLIDTGGVLRYAHRNRGALDNPSTWSLIQVACVLTGNVVEPPEPYVPPDDANRNGSAADGLASGSNGQHGPANFACVRCGHTECEVLDVSATSGMLSRVFNYQHRRFSAIACMRCTYTEFYKSDSSALRNIFDLFLGS